jgi:hypothetical protein
MRNETYRERKLRALARRKRIHNALDRVMDSMFGTAMPTSTGMFRAHSKGLGAGLKYELKHLGGTKP